ncbi:Hypothetical predicted protein [Cloeon dipterum]|uniref:Uncharacterized protein n=1 Tax=Cloeon dipterum TaxID=197152 RepID=A0A8S1CFS5_9INSE|nr:Hypothetical predicted protein [Cloeon dipterum]
MGRCYIFLSIFLAQLIALSAHDGKSGTCKHKGAQVLRTAEDVDWTSVVMPFFSSFGFAGGNRRVGCNCQLTTPNPREICPTNATMNVTSGKHSWWDGLGMRRFRTRRHAHFSSGRKFRKSISLKDGCPVRVPLQPCPKKLQQCPEKLQRGRRSPHKGGRGRGGGGRSGGRWDDSSEEQGAQRSRNGKYYYRVTIKEKGDSGQLRCTDPTTKQTKVMCNQGGTTSYSTVMLTSTVYSYGTREDEEDDNGNGEQGDDYQLQDPIDTSPISGSRTEFTISPTRSRRPYEPTIMLTEELEFPGTSMVKSTPSVSIEQSESSSRINHFNSTRDSFDKHNAFKNGQLHCSSNKSENDNVAFIIINGTSITNKK